MILFFIALFTVTFGFSQEITEAALDPSFSAIKSLFWPAVSGGLLMLFLEAKKYMFTPEWDWLVFLKTNALPFGLSIIGAVAIYLILAYVPFLKPYLEAFTESDLTEVTAGSLIGAATIAIKFIMKPKVTAPVEGENAV